MKLRVVPSDFVVDRSKRTPRAGLIWAIILGGSVIASALIQYGVAR